MDEEGQPAPGMVIAIDGEGVTPETVDGAALLRLADRYVAALAKAAKDAGIQLAPLPGLRVVDKCAGIGLMGQAPMYQRASVALFVARTENPGNAVFRELDDEIAKLPEGQWATVHAGDWQADLKVAYVDPYAYVERVERDVVVDGVYHGAKDDSVVVTDCATGQSFTLHAARDIGLAASTLYTREVLIEADLEVEMGTHKIRGGRLLQIEPLNTEWDQDQVVDWMRSEFDPRKLDS